MSFACPGCGTVLDVVTARSTPVALEAVELELLRMAKFWNIPLEHLRSQSKTRRIALIRRVIYTALRRRGFASTAIAYAMNRDHSSVLKGVFQVGEHEREVRVTIEAVRVE